MPENKAQKLKEDFIRHLDEIAFFLEFNEGNPFKIRAYNNATRLLKGVTAEDLVERIKAGKLSELEGIGKGITHVAESFLKTGKSDEWKEARGKLPEGLAEIRQINGLGFKKVHKIYADLKIKSLKDLEAACKKNKLADLPSFGKKVQDNILKQIEDLKS